MLHNIKTHPSFNSIPVIAKLTCLRILWLLSVMVSVVKLEAQDLDPPLILPGIMGYPVRSIDFSPDGKSLAASTDSGLVRLWDPTTGELQKVLDTVPGYPIIYFARYSPIGNRIAAGTFDGRLIVWDVESGKIIHSIQVVDDFLASVEFGDNGSKIFVSASPDIFHVYDTESGALLYEIRDSEYLAGAATFLPDERAFLTVWAAKEQSMENGNILLRKWSLDDGSLIREYDIPQDTSRPTGAFLINPDGSRWYRVAYKGVAQVPYVNNWLIEIDPQTFEDKRELPLPDSSRIFLSFDFSPDGKSLLCTNFGQVFIWDLESGDIKLKLYDGPGRFYIDRGQFSPDGKTVAAGGVSFEIHIWHLPTSSVRESPAAREKLLQVGNPRPNPAGDLVEIPFSLSGSALVTVTLADVSGREVGRINEKSYSEGSHALLYDVSALSSGYYSCVIRAGETVQTRSLHVIR